MRSDAAGDSRWPCGPLLRVALLDADGAAAAAADPTLLALISFNAAAESDPRRFVVPLAEADGGGLIEAWYGTGDVRSGYADSIAFAANDVVMFACLVVEEAAAGGLEAAVSLAYRRLFTFIRSNGFPHLWRVWHYFSAIHEDAGGLDRYQAFCRGRYGPMTQALPEFEQGLPAASAIGARSGPLTLHAIACRRQGLQIENPRQVSAFHYPPAYGPKSPSFSRSVLMAGSDEAPCLLLSGTASITGYVTRHAGDLSAQIGEALANVAAVIDAAERHQGHSLRPASLRAYVRNATSARLVRASIAAHFGPMPPPLVILQGDICRRDLLLEIEGVFTG